VTPLWVYKCNNRQHEHQISWGDWRDFFRLAKGRPLDWGGTGYIGSGSSLRIIRHEMQPGDLVLAWQTDRREAVGLCRVHDLRPSEGDDEIEWEIILEPVEEFDPPVKLAAMKKRDPALAAVKAVRAGLIATLYGTTYVEARVLLDRCGVDPIVLERPKRVVRGGGFGTAEENRKVEQAAVAVVTKEYKRDGWSVRSVENGKCGFDLVATKGRRVEHIEVKGTRGVAPQFILTAGEVSASESDRRWKLAVVADALAKDAYAVYLDGGDLEDLDLRALSYMTTIPTSWLEET
jgi:hypothetical protein